ncbi:hypothetical protein D3C86_1339220 [compost metagenome]
MFLVQLKSVPATFPESAIVVMVLEEQIVCVAGVAPAFGFGFTINSDDLVSVKQPLFTIQL